jgi:hypothetical protein
MPGTSENQSVILATRIIPQAPIDVAGWTVDEEFASYPEGARAKTACFPPAEPLPDYIKPGRRYLFKRSREAFPEQFWAEIAAYHIGGLLGIEVPPAYPAINSSSGQCAALIEWFYEDGKTRFVLGGDFMQKMHPGFDRDRGSQHNFHSIRILFRTIHRHGWMESDWQTAWGHMLLLDALCGNTDRHQDNWGVLFDFTDEGLRVRLSPCYDNGTSLGHELSEHIQGTNWDDARWLRYVNRGAHHMKWTLESPHREGHLSGVKKFVDLFPLLRDLILSRLSAFDMAELRDALNRLAEIPMTVPLSPWRANLIHRLVELRRDLLLRVLQ